MAEEPDGWTEVVDALARLAARLPAGHVRAWAAVLRRRCEPGRSLEAELIAGVPGGGSAPLAADLAAVWRRSPATSGEAMALALLAASEVSERAERHRAQMVVTGPSTSEQSTRLTSAAITQLVDSARHELLVVSFAAYRSAGLVGALAAAAARGVRVDLVLEDTTGASGAFTGLAGKAGFWHWPRAERGAGGRASLHAKVVAADRKHALVGSANLTGHALNENIEAGVLLHAPLAVDRLVGHFRSLMHADGPLRPLRGGGRQW
ncbi:DISARM system phospholipase D-like protein DrmC [Streptomonospora algeriensis]|uniref:DISARM system phospholipase D-like protein DrmC n=1 Tax=Streptomonospora algeriensis TaxID=995084 RepID=A0ABW3BAG4_9ACTN